MIDSQGFFMPYYVGDGFAGDLVGKELEKLAKCHEITRPEGEFSSHTRSSDNYFLAAAAPQNLVVRKWFEALYERMYYIMTHKPKISSYAYFIAQCTFTQVRIADTQVEKAWTLFRSSNPDIWAKTKQDGMCYGGDGNSVAANYARKRCFFEEQSARGSQLTL